MNEISESTYDAINALRQTTSTNEKLFVLNSNKNNKEFANILKLTYDHITYTYNVRAWNFLRYDCNETSDYSMYEVLDMLNNRDITGNSALCECKKLWNSLCPEDQKIFCQIIDRDLKVGLSSKTLNKVWKGLIPKPNYNRCATFNRSTASKFKYPAIIQLKCDGTYREAYVHAGSVTFKTRTGEPYDDPILEKAMNDFDDGYYTGEFTIGRADHPDMNRAASNGNVNSDNPDYEHIHFTIWDYLTEDEYTLKVKTPYGERFERLKKIIDSHKCELVQLVPSYEINDVSEALKKVSEWMNMELEGGVLKSKAMKFKNGTSNEQLKIKLCVDADMRCVGFQKGSEGTKYEGTNKVVIFENDDHTVQGRCSGMTDDMVNEVTANPEKYIGKILTVQFNDLSLAEGSNVYALSHPRFIEWRNDKDETDDLNKVIELRDMARNL